jgi:undecaprenyl-diphosphatase
MKETWLEVWVLGVVQGITEFLPVSSSGHLTLFQYFMRLQEPELLLDVVLHGGTLVALLVVFRRDLIQITRGTLGDDRKQDGALQPPPVRILVYIAAGSLVTGLVGIGLHDRIENIYSGIGALGPCWMFTGTILWVTRQVPPTKPRVMGLWDAVLVGLAQSLALAPGISRSGITIATGLMLRWDRKWAVTFSFLLCVPATVGALILEISKGNFRSTGWGLLFVGGITSMIVGWFSLRWLVKIVLRGKLYRFAWYCWLMGVVVMLLWMMT